MHINDFYHGSKNLILKVKEGNGRGNAVNFWWSRLEDVL